MPLQSAAHYATGAFRAGILEIPRAQCARGTGRYLFIMVQWFRTPGAFGIDLIDFPHVAHAKPHSNFSREHACRALRGKSFIRGLAKSKL